MEQKLKEAHDAAQRSTESKTRFLSNMSHEIRTPLIGITGMLNFLLDTELTAEQTDYVHTIQQSAESLLVVINDILDLSKVEAGMMKLEWEPFNLVTTIEDTNELMSTLAIQKNLELSFWIDNDIPNVIVGDRVRLRQVLLNLIGVRMVVFVIIMMTINSMLLYRMLSNSLLKVKCSQSALYKN